jgi:hypothetical protein
MTGPFRALYDGVCAAGCDSRIHPGDLIRYEGDELVHNECAPAHDRFTIGPDEVICPDCFLVRPCKCVD